MRSTQGFLKDDRKYQSDNLSLSSHVANKKRIPSTAMECIELDSDSDNDLSPMIEDTSNAWTTTRNTPTGARHEHKSGGFGDKLYPDVRNHFIKALIKSSKGQRRST
jgi:hypothetical protein